MSQLTNTQSDSDVSAKKILIMAGGTGGHIFPALATAHVLKQKGMHIEWLGTQKGMESRIVPENNYPINYIEIGGLRGKGLKTLLMLPFRLSRALFQTLGVFRKLKPDVILGMGGFVTGPGGIVGWLMGVPLVLHEQNAIAGMTNKILYRFSSKVLAAFPGAFEQNKQSKNKLSIIGNPVRKEIMILGEPEYRFEKKWADSDTEQLNILIVGGSLGAAALNEAIPKALEEIYRTEQIETSAFDKINIRHQCGAKNLGPTTEYYHFFLGAADKNEKIQSKIEVEVMSFIDDMAASYAWADLVICRSGALTVSEIASVGIASLLVPYPHAVDDHQTANADYLVKGGAAFVVQQKKLDTVKLIKILMSLDKKVILDMATKARHLSINNAAEVVADECLLLAG